MTFVDRPRHGYDRAYRSLEKIEKQLNKFYRIVKYIQVGFTDNFCPSVNIIPNNRPQTTQSQCSCS